MAEQNNINNNNLNSNNININSHNNMSNNNNAIMIPAGPCLRKKESRPKMDLEALTLKNLSRFIKYAGHETMFLNMVDDLIPHPSLSIKSCINQMKALIF